MTSPIEYFDSIKARWEARGEIIHVIKVSSHIKPEWFDPAAYGHHFSVGVATGVRQWGFISKSGYDRFKEHLQPRDIIE